MSADHHPRRGQALDPASVGAQEHRGVVAAVGVVQAAGVVVVDAEEERGVVVRLAGVVQELVDLGELRRQRVAGLGRAAPQARLEARHQEGRREALARDVGQHQPHAARAEVEEVVVVAPHARACRQPPTHSSVSSCGGAWGRSRRCTWAASSSSWSVRRSVSMRWAISSARRIPSRAMPAWPATVSSSRRSSPEYGSSESRGPSTIRSEQTAVAPGERHEALGLEGTEGLEGPRLPDVVVGAGRRCARAPRGSREARGRPGGPRVGRGDGVQPAVAALEVHGQGPRQQRRVDLLLQQLRDLLAAARGADPGGQLLEDVVDVVGPAEEGPVDPLAHPPVKAGRTPGQQRPEACPEGERDRRGPSPCAE